MTRRGRALAALAAVSMLAMIGVWLGLSRPGPSRDASAPAVVVDLPEERVRPGPEGALAADHEGGLAGEPSETRRWRAAVHRAVEEANRACGWDYPVACEGVVCVLSLSGASFDFWEHALRHPRVGMELWVADTLDTPELSPCVQAMQDMNAAFGYGRGGCMMAYPTQFSATFPRPEAEASALEVVERRLCQQLSRSR